MHPHRQLPETEVAEEALAGAVRGEEPQVQEVAEAGLPEVPLSEVEYGLEVLRAREVQSPPAEAGVAASLQRRELTSGGH